MDSSVPLYIDFISDIHIDQWDPLVGVKYPCGEVKNHPIDWNKILLKSKILVIAGDISDDIDISIDYLNSISRHYDKILFVDGNHEHVNNYPELLTFDKIDEKVSRLNNDKLIYLPMNDFILDDIVFIGYCGWWDYCSGDSNMINKCMNYLTNWIPSFGEEENDKFINEVLSRAELEKELLLKKINKYESDNKINKIIIVTHSPPVKEFCSPSRLVTEYNNGFNEIINLVKDKKISKLKLWLSGHIHTDKYSIIDNLELINHPRGRPEDHDRVNYSVLKVKI